MRSIKINFSTEIIILFLISISFVNILKAQNTNSISGYFAPKGKPTQPPVRIEAGQSCIIDLIEDYTISGSISGTIEMNYRIIVYGKCGFPPGTFDEDWIAYGTFHGMLNGKERDAKLSYTAKVKAGGEVNGIIDFGQGINVKVMVSGNFSDGKLIYQGEIN